MRLVPSLPIHWARRAAVAGLVGLVILGLAGCEEPEIKKYNAPRDKPTPDFTRLSSYQLPAGWTRMSKPVELSVASFTVGEGDKAVIITVSRFPGEGGGATANVNRWRDKVGLEPLKPEQIKDMPTLTVDGEKAIYVDVASPKDKKDPKRILGAIADRGIMTWFFKMQGPPEQVEQQKTAFETFIQSVKFGGTGGNDE
jgi:hypothetical protein